MDSPGSWRVDYGGGRRGSCVGVRTSESGVTSDPRVGGGHECAKEDVHKKGYFRHVESRTEPQTKSPLCLRVCPLHNSRHSPPTPTSINGTRYGPGLFPLSVSLCLFVSVSVWLPPSLFISLCLSLFVSVWLSLFLCLSVPVSVHRGTSSSTVDPPLSRPRRRTVRVERGSQALALDDCPTCP